MVQVGDKVEWQETSMRGRRLTSSLRKGVVEAVSEEGIATVRWGKKSLFLIPVEALKPGEGARRMEETVEALRSAPATTVYCARCGTMLGLIHPGANAIATAHECPTPLPSEEDSTTH